jgi:BarA-like signal transduction histidine kinase
MTTSSSPIFNLAFAAGLTAMALSVAACGRPQTPTRNAVDVTTTTGAVVTTRPAIRALPTQYYDPAYTTVAWPSRNL